jgi:26S proteasome regulatory subunit N6
MVSTVPSDRLQQVEILKEAKKFEEVVAQYKAILAETSSSDEVLKEQEYALVQLGQLYRELG